MRRRILLAAMFRTRSTTSVRSTFTVVGADVRAVFAASSSSMQEEAR